MYIDKYIINTINNDINIKYDNEYIDHLFEQINFNNFWFLKNEKTLYGGLMEWAVKNYNMEEDKNETGMWMEWSSIDINKLKYELDVNQKWPVGHPSNKMNELFVKQELLTKII
jgi:hypothetical protein